MAGNKKLSDYSRTNKQNNQNKASGTYENKSADSPSHNNPNEDNGENEETNVHCPHYTERLSKCKQEATQERIEYLNLDNVRCGYAIQYLYEESNVTLAKSTAEGYSSYLSQYTEFLHNQGTTVCKSDLSDIRKYFRNLVQLDRAEETISCHRTAITNLHKYIKLYEEEDPNVNWLVIREEINPSEFNTPERRKREPLEKEEVKKLYEALNNFRNRLMVQVAVEIGSRNEDVCGVKTNNVDLEEGKIEMTNTKSGGSYSVPISDELQLLLRRWITQERDAHFKTENNEYLFPSQLGGRLSTGMFCQIVKKAAKRAGIQEKEKSSSKLSEREKEVLNTDKERKEFCKVTPHTLRHTFNYLLEDAGIPREYRSEALDHESEEVTKEFYDHNESSYQELIQELFSENKSLVDI